MANTKVTKSFEKLIQENNELKVRLTKMEEELRNSEDRYHQMFDQHQTIKLLIDPETGIIVDANHAAVKYYGYTYEQLCSLRIQDINQLPSYEVEAERKKALSEQHNSFIFPHRLSNGEIRWVEVFSSPLFHNGRKLLYSIIHDITSRKNAEEQLRLSEERFSKAFKNSPNAITITRFADGKIIDGNDSVYSLLGYNHEEVVGKTTLDLGIWTNSADRLKLANALASKGSVNNEEFVLSKKDGTHVHVNLSASIIYIEKEQCFICSFIDLTERKLAEDALRESEERYRNLFSLMPSGVAVYDVINEGKDPDGKDFIFKDMNPAGEKTDHVKREEIVGKSLFDFFPNVREMGLPEVFQNVWKSGVPEYFPVTLYADNRLTLWIVNYVWKLPTGELVALFEDITEQKKAEKELLETTEALRESESRFRTLSESIPDMIVRLDKDLRLRYANSAVLKRTGLPLEAMIGKTVLDYSGDTKWARNWHNAAIEVINSGELRRIDQYSVWQGIKQFNDVLLIPEKDSDGTVKSIISIARDITAMKSAEITLRQSEQRLKYHLENSPLAVVEWDKNFKIIQWSDEAERMFGRKKNDVLGIPVNDLNIIYEEDYPIVEKTMERLVSGKELKVISHNRNYNKDREVIECIWYNSVLLDENQEMSSVLSLVQDTTKLRQTELLLRESRESYKELVKNARSMILKFDNEANITFINDYALEFFGYKLNELLGKSVMIVVPKVDSTGKDLDEMVENIIKDPDKYSININENIKKNGEKVWVEWHNKATFDKSGNKTGHIAIGIDVTQRRIAEENLKESERKLKSVLNATLESIYMFDTSGIIWMTNTTGVKRLKRNSETEIIGHHFSEFMTPEITQSRMKMHQQVIQTGQPYEFEDERDNRTYHHSFSPVIKDNKVLYVVTYSEDITDRKNSELQLKQSEDRLRTIAESLTTMISITRKKDSVTLFANEPYLKTFGLTSAEVIGKKDPDIFVHPEDRNEIQDILDKTDIVDNKEIKVKRSDGSQFWIITSIRKITYMGEISFLSSSIDITETKRTQEELLRLNRTLDAHSKSSHAMLHSTDEFSYLNEVCKIIIKDCGHSMVWVGYAENDKNKSVTPVAYYGFDQGYIDQMRITWDDSEYGRGPTGTAIKTCRPSICKNMLTDPRFEPWREAAISRGFASSLVLPLISEGRSFGAVSIYSREPDSFSDSEIDLLNDLVDDLAHGISYLRLSESERAAARVIKESESKLKDLIITKDKFFNIVAHDLKNPFTSLLGSSELLYDNINQMSADNVKKLALILNDSARGGFAILQNLLDWSRSQTGLLRFCPEKLNLRSIIDENIENFTLQTSNKGIRMKSELRTDLILFADKNMINTVLRNLLSNAIKFTHKNGEVAIKVRELKNEVVVSVCDTGIGVSKDKIEMLFRLENGLSMPGTEKEQGTGLGLKLCKEFTEIMGGRIWVESEPEMGSKFNFTIPFKKN